MFGEVLQQGKTNKGVHHLCICNLYFTVYTINMLVIGSFCLWLQAAA